MMEHFHIGVLFILGISVFGGILGATCFQKARVPQVMGYVTIGIILGMSGFQLINNTDITHLQPLNQFALGIIGFLVGGELKVHVFKKYGYQFLAILLGEGIGAFALVGGGTTLVIYMVCHNWAIAGATGVVFGAIASATDPASTIDVLWENRSKGALTTSITAIVALDDALAMTLYGIGTCVASILTSNTGSIGHELLVVSVELFGAIIMGGVFGGILLALIKLLHCKEKSIALTLGLLLLLISISEALNLDVILATMTTGFIIINAAPRRADILLQTIREFSIPIYVLFFVMVGARLDLGAMPGWLWVIVAIYVLGRTIGKVTGAYMGASITKSPTKVKKYLGMGILAQGGVAVGLSIIAGSHLNTIMVTETLSVGDSIVFAITATTLIAQIIGPPLTKLAVTLANENNLDVKEEDLVDHLPVSKVVDNNCPTIMENLTLAMALQKLTASRYKSLPVVSCNGNVRGMLSLDDMRELIFDQDAWQWLIVGDVIEGINHCVLLAAPLKESLSKIREMNIDCLPVIYSNDNKEYAGVLSLPNITKVIAEELVKHQQII